MSDEIQKLTYEDCLKLLRGERVGRIGVVVDGHPIVLPVNYKLVETPAVTWVAVRTRPGNVLDHPGPAALEIDGIDTERHAGWSVLVQGTLERVDPDAADFAERFDPEPWVSAERDAWLVIEPFSITGRVISGTEPTWAFVSDAYL